MQFITPRKAAQGLGSARSGTADHWFLTVTSAALVLLVPAFMLVVGRAIGMTQAELLLYFGRPYPALITGLFVVVGMLHFIKGTRIMIDDYLQDTTRKVAIIGSVILSWAVIAAALFALARMTLAPLAI